MTKDLFSGVLTFALLIGGTVAVGSAMLGLDGQTAAAPAQTAQVAVVTMPAVNVIGHRDIAVATSAQADSTPSTVE